LDSLLDFSMDLKLMVFTKSTRSKRICDSNGAPYFADQRPEMFVLLIKIKMEQSMIKTKYIWAILDSELGIQLNFEFKGVYVNTTLAENSVCKLCNRIALLLIALDKTIHLTCLIVIMVKALRGLGCLDGFTSTKPWPDSSAHD
jgi:hypothetical protein